MNLHSKECPINDDTIQPTKAPRDAADQPLPTKNDNPIIQDLLIKDIQERTQIGIKRYGTALQAHNGRDALTDAYQESMDLSAYLRQCLFERDGK